MQLGIIFGMFIYFIAVILIVGYYVNKKRKQDEDGSFALGGRSLGTFVLGFSLVFIILGSGHTIAVFEGAYHLGFGQVWFVIAHGFLLVIVCVFTGIWARRMRVTSLGEIIKKLYGEQLTVLIASLNIIVGWVVVSAETQATGVIVNALTGLNLNVAALIGGLAGMLYVLIGGMKQNAILNFINIIVFYFSFALATFFIARGLPGRNFDTIQTFYVESGQSVLLSFTGGPGFLLLVALPSLLSPLFCHATGQIMLQTCMSAKNEKVIRRAAFFVGPMNALVGVFAVTLALTAKALPEYAHFDPKVMTTQMLVDLLPTWLLVVMLAALFGAIVSSYAGFVLGSATCLAVDFVKGLYKPNMTERELAKWIRIFLVIGSLVGISLAQALPPIIMLFVWLFSFLVPVFFVYLYGLWWKRNLKVGILACVVPWILSTLWTFTPIAGMLGLQDLHHLYITLFIGNAILIIGNLVTKGEVGYFRSQEYFNSEGYKMYLEEKARGDA